MEKGPTWVECLQCRSNNSLGALSFSFFMNLLLCHDTNVGTTTTIAATKAPGFFTLRHSVSVFVTSFFHACGSVVDGTSFRPIPTGAQDLCSAGTIMG